MVEFGCLHFGSLACTSIDTRFFSVDAASANIHAGLGASPSGASVDIFKRRPYPALPANTCARITSLVTLSVCPMSSFTRSLPALVESLFDDPFYQAVSTWDGTLTRN